MFAPDYQKATGLLSHLNSEELKELLNDEGKLESMISDLEQVKQVSAEKEMVLANNKSLAEYNLSLGPELEHGRQELMLQYEAASAVRENVQKLRSQMASKKCQTGLDTVLALLQTAAAQAEEASELLVEDLLNGKSDIDTFLKDFLKDRTRVHLLRTKSEKMAALLPGGIYRSPPAKPRRAKKPPPPPPAANKPVIPASTASPGVPKPNTDHIVPTRVAPHPPVVIPRRQVISPPAVASSHLYQPRANLPYPAKVSYPFPQPVKLSN